MKKLFENWQNYLQEDSEEQSEKPKVICNCLCTDCIFNDKKEDPHCIAETIKLKHSTNAEGQKICECLTYEVSKEEVDESAWSGNGPPAQPIEEP